MDKKNTFIGIAFLLVGFGLMFWQGQHMVSVPAQESQVAEVATALPITDTAFSLAQVIKNPQETVIQSEEEILYTLENDAIIVRFTNRGGAIKDIELKQFQLELDSQDKFVFNAETNQPALSISIGDTLPKDFSPRYELIDISHDTIRFRHTTVEGLEVIRAYNIALSTQSNREPYLITHETRFTNKSEYALDLKNIFINVGSFPETPGDTMGEYLNFGYYNGKSAEFVKITEFRDSKGFFGIGSHTASTHKLIEPSQSVLWASAKNQFFASVLTPSQSGQGVFVQPTKLNTANSTQDGITGSLLFKLGSLQSNESKILDMQYYVGPKELRRLENLGHNEELIMQFGFFGFISKLLLSVMLMINAIIPNWGLTIIAVTVLIKLILWPLTTAQVRSAKRMSALQEPLKALKEKYAGNPQKLQAETMRLFKENKVNPVAGCLPLVVQLPIFLGLYFMLRTSAELRFAPFLWIPDLSVPDTITHIAGFPLNPLPLVMGVTMWWQMKSTPSPTTDETQKKIFQFMPFVFLFFCYNFPSGLVLYWTVQNLLTVAQQYITGRSTTAVITASSPSKSTTKPPFKK